MKAVHRPGSCVAFIAACLLLNPSARAQETRTPERNQTMAPEPAQGAVR